MSYEVRVDLVGASGPTLSLTRKTKEEAGTQANFIIKHGFSYTEGGVMHFIPPHRIHAVHVSATPDDGKEGA